ncbi:spindle assembly checkpoint component Mad1 [Tricharina praecox]|uniref:spindle assembly checkpoint component Mad1 n=1 Tax=Tricharina praecox TaxID=43433 RepID=UPI002220E68D|nr:spindle assembly checkpoint component Mad1 [Tricharina praecox]KAI5848920.1 spindle assembly checkpoint component Mad1 [Tricharina praecox]
MNSPFENRPRGSTTKRGTPKNTSSNNIFSSPVTKRQLFPNNPPIRQPLQPTYDFLSGDAGGPATPSPPPSVTPVSAQRKVRVDISNEVIRGDLNSVRYELQMLKEERSLEKIRHEQECRALEAVAEEHAKRADTLESDKRFLFEKQKDLGEKLQEMRAEAAEAKRGLERQVRQLRAESAELREAVRDKEEDLSSQERQYKRQIDEYETRSNALSRANQELKEEVHIKDRTIEEVQRKLEGKDGEAQELEIELLSAKAQTGDLGTLKVLKKELAEQVNHIKTLESTNRRQLLELKSLRESSRSLELVEEEKRTLEGKLKMLNEIREELSAAQVRISVLQDERNAWESYFQREGLEFDSPESLARALIEERVERIGLTEKAGRLEPELLEKDQIIQEMEGEVRLLREELEKLKETASKDSKARQRMERQKALALKEAQFLREQLKSFSTEEAIHNQGNFDEQKTARIQELETLLEAYKTEIDELKTAASAAAASSTSNEAQNSRKRALEDTASDERLGELNRRNRQLQNDIMQLQRKETVLNAEIEALHFRITSMEGTSIRILQLKDNPTAREQAVKVSQLKALQEENAALLAQIEGRGEEVRMVPRATLENVRAEIKAMEKVVAEKEKRMMRLKEIWSAKSLEFREAVFSLLGWKLDFMQNGRVRVTHMFGDESQSIEFDGEKGTMKVAGGPDSMFHKEIRNQCSFWMARQSIPCLLASILIEQYEKTTRAQFM